MSIGPQGNWVSGVVGAQAGHQRSSETDRKASDSASQIAAANLERSNASDGSLHDSEAAQDRDADGRDLGRHPFAKDSSKNRDKDASSDSDLPPTSRDATGHVGRNLDLTG